MSISDTTIYTDIFTEIRQALVSASIVVTDDLGATKLASVSPAYVNDRKTVPQIVIEGNQKSESIDKFGAVNGKQTINVTVGCYFITAKGKEQLAQGVESAIKNATLSMTLNEISSDDAFVDPNYGDYHVKSITFTFDRE